MINASSTALGQNGRVGARTVVQRTHGAQLVWGLLSQFPPFRYFPNFSSLSKHTLTVTYRVYIWQVSPQLSCGDTCQILMWFDESNMYFCKIENFAYGEIDERSFSNPHPWAVVQPDICTTDSCTTDTWNRTLIQPDIYTIWVVKKTNICTSGHL